MKHLRSGEVVQVIHPDGLGVEQGALARVVDGPSEFPSLTADLQRRLGEYSGVVDMSDLVCVVWVRSDERWRGQPDGFYVADRFRLAVQQDEYVPVRESGWHFQGEEVAHHPPERNTG